MHIVTISEASQHFDELMKEVRQGEVIEIMDGETPVGRLVPLNSATTAFDRVGFLQGQGHVPQNWKELGRDESDAEL